MNFLIDEQLPLSLVDWLVERGYRAVHVRSAGLISRKDVSVAAYARENGMVLVSKDRDFGPGTPLVNLPPVIWVRVGNASTTHLLSRLARSWPEVLAWLEAGEAIIEIR